MNSLGECYAMGRGVPRIWKRPWNGIAARRSWAKPWRITTWDGIWSRQGKLSEAYVHYRKAADGNDDSAWWALGRFMKTASSLRRTERKRAAAMKLARNWAV